MYSEFSPSRAIQKEAQKKNRQDFLRKVVLLGRDQANTQSQSDWKNFPVEMQKLILSFLFLPGSLSRTQETINHCIHLVFTHSEKIAEALTAAHFKKASQVRIDNFSLRFFCEPEKPIKTAKQSLKPYTRKNYTEEIARKQEFALASRRCVIS